MTTRDFQRIDTAKVSTVPPVAAIEQDGPLLPVAALPARPCTVHAPGKLPGLFPATELGRVIRDGPVETSLTMHLGPAPAATPATPTPNAAGGSSAIMRRASQARAGGLCRKYGTDGDLRTGGPQISNSRLLMADRVDMIMPGGSEALDYVTEELPFLCIGAILRKNPQVLTAHAAKARHDRSDERTRPCTLQSGPVPRRTRAWCSRASSLLFGAVRHAPSRRRPGDDVDHRCRL